MVKLLLKTPDLDLQLENELTGYDEETSEKARKIFKKYFKWGEILRVEIDIEKEEIKVVSCG